MIGPGRECQIGPGRERQMGVEENAMIGPGRERHDRAWKRMP